MCLVLFLIGHFLIGKESKKYEYTIPDLNLEIIHLQFQFTIHPSIVKVILEKLEAIQTLQTQPIEAQMDNLDTLKIYFVGLGLNILTLDIKSNNIKDHEIGLKAILDAIFGTYTGIDESSKKPYFLRFWEIVSSQYRSYYSNVWDESYYLVGGNNETTKDKINIIMGNLLEMVAFSMGGVVTHAETNGEKLEYLVEEKYLLSMCTLTEDLVNMLDGFSYKKNYASILVLLKTWEVLKTMALTKFAVEMHAIFKIVNKIEELLQWSFSKDFEEEFEAAKDSKYFSKIIEFSMRVIKSTPVTCGFKTNEKSNEKFIAHLSSFSYFELIRANDSLDKKPKNKYASNAREEIVRNYVELHLIFQQYLCRNQNIFYNKDSLKEAWSIIINNCTIDKDLNQEFSTIVHIQQVIGTPFDQVFEVNLFVPFLKECLFNVHVDCNVNKIYQLATVLKSYWDHSEVFEAFKTQLSNYFQETFEDLLQEEQVLSSLLSNSEKFRSRKKLYNFEFRISSFLTRLFAFLNLTGTGESITLTSMFTELLNAYLPKIAASPLFYLMGERAVVMLIDLYRPERIKENPLVDSLLDFLPDPAQDTSFARGVLKEDSACSKILQSKINTLTKNNLRFTEYFTECFLDDPFEVHLINSNLFHKVYLNNVHFCPKTSSSIRNYIEPRLIIYADITKLILEFCVLYFKASKTVPNKSTISTISSLVLVQHSIILKNDAMIFEQKYTRDKKKLLVSILICCNKSKSEEDDFLYRVCALLYLEEIKPAILDRSFKELLSDFAELLQFWLEMFTNVLPNILSNSTNLFLFKNVDEKSDKSKRSSENKVYLLQTLPQIFENHFNDTFHDAKVAKNMNYNLEEREQNFKKYNDVAELTLQFIDTLDSKLLYLHTFRESFPMANPYNKVVKVVYDLSMQTLIDILEFKDSNHMFEQSIIDNNIAMNSELESNQLELDDKVSREKLVLSKVVLFYQPGFSLFHYKTEHFSIVKNILTDYSLLISTFDTEITDNIDLSIKLSDIKVPKYKNTTINKLRVLCPLTSFLINLKTSKLDNDETELNFYVETSKLFLEVINKLIEQLDIQEVLEEDKTLVECDFLQVYNMMLKDLVTLTSNAFENDVKFGTYTLIFIQNFDVTLKVLRKWPELDSALPSARNQCKNIFQGPDKESFLSHGFQYASYVHSYHPDEQLLSLLFQFASYSFYSLIESYALQAYEPEKIIQIKLNALVNLDKSGKRLTTSLPMNRLQQFWSTPLEKVWKENFRIQDFNDPVSSKLTKIVVLNDPGKSLLFLF